MSINANAAARLPFETVSRSSSSRFYVWN